MLQGCSRPDDPHQQLQSTLDELETAIEQRDRRAVKSFFSDDFLAAIQQKQENLDLLMRYHFRINQRVEVIRYDETITLQAKAADVTGEVVLLGTSNFLPERGRRFSYESRWVQQGDKWKLQRLRSQSVTDH